MSVNFDHQRNKKTGIPEVILAGPKADHDLISAISAGFSRENSLLLTRVEPHQVEILDQYLKENSLIGEKDSYNRTYILSTMERVKPVGDPLVAILSGGTSDEPIVEETRLCLSYFGISSIKYSDVGVAGMHRHQQVLANLPTSIRLLIVAAGNEGALFTAVSAQTKLPVIAVPVSVGYGLGGKGKAALYSALQSCSPGVVTVNIDNGFGAAAFARKMLVTTGDL